MSTIQIGLRKGNWWAGVLAYLALMLQLLTHLVCWQRGVNPTSVEEIHLRCGDSTTLQEGETLCLVNGLYHYRIRFEQDSRSPKKTVREYFSPRCPLKEDDNMTQPPKRSRASSPSEDEDDDPSVVEKLRQLQEIAAQVEQERRPSPPALPNLPSHPRDSWEDFGKLLVFTKKGVIPSTKVRPAALVDRWGGGVAQR